MRSQRFLLRLGVAVGASLVCAPLLGIARTMIGMSQALATLGRSGIGDPQPLFQAIAETLFATTSGLFLFPFGVVLLVICLRLLKHLRGLEPPPLPQLPEHPGIPPR